RLVGQRATMQFSRALYDRETQTRALGRTTSPPERLEQFLGIYGSEAGPIVLDYDIEARAERDADVRAVRRVLDRITDQVPQRFSYRDGVDQRFAIVIRRHERELVLAAYDPWPHLAYDILGQRGHIHALEVRRLQRLQSRQSQETVDRAGHGRHIGL